MKKTMIVFVSVLFVGGMFTSCGQQKLEPAPKKKQVFTQTSDNVKVLRKEPDPAPKWVYDEDWAVQKENGNKVIYFLIQSKRTTLKKEMFDIKAEKGVLLAGMIKQFSSVEMVKASEGMLNDEGDMDTYFSQVSASISRNVNTGMAQPAGSYWEQVAETDKDGNIKQYFRVVKRYSMEYADFKQQIIEAAKKEPLINKKMKDKSGEFVNKMDQQLDKVGE